jgi:hypothetical protein
MQDTLVSFPGMGGWRGFRERQWRGTAAAQYRESLCLLKLLLDSLTKQRRIAHLWG